MVTNPVAPFIPTICVYLVRSPDAQQKSQTRPKIFQSRVKQAFRTPLAPSPGVSVPDVSQVTLRLREIWETGIANGLKRQQISDWVRHVSDEAFKRLEERKSG